MNKILSLILPLICFSIFINTVNAQYVNLFGGVKLSDFKGSNVRLSYIDESPAPDVFFSDQSIKNKLNYTLGGSYDNFSHKQELYYNAIGSVNFGELIGIDVGASIGYSLLLNGSKSISVVPALTGGLIYTNKPMGKLVNRTTYIQVNETIFYDDVNVALARMDIYLKPNLNILFDITNQYQIRVSGAYLIDLNVEKNIRFTDQNKSAKESTDASNISYYVDGQKTNTIPFNTRGFEFRLGFAYSLAKDKEITKKK